MSDTLILKDRKENNVVVEGSIQLSANPETAGDIDIIIPNKNGRYITQESLETSELTISIMNGCKILFPRDNQEECTGIFRISNPSKSDTYNGTPTNFILEISRDINFTTVIKTIDKANSFNTDFIVTFETTETDWLYARVKCYDDRHISNYSETIKFKLVDYYVHKPTILSPANDTTNMAWEIGVRVSDYFYTGEGNFCDTLVYQVSENTSFEEPFMENSLYRTDNTITDANFLNYVKNFEIIGLNEGTTYYIRVAYVGKISGQGPWSEPIRITTFNIPNREYYSNRYFCPNIITEDKFRYICSALRNEILISKVNSKFENIITKSIVLTDNFAKNIVVKRMIDSLEYLYLAGFIVNMPEDSAVSFLRISRSTNIDFNGYNNSVTFVLKIKKDLTEEPIIKYFDNVRGAPYNDHVGVGELEDIQIAGDKIYVLHRMRGRQVASVYPGYGFITILDLNLNKLSYTSIEHSFGVNNSMEVSNCFSLYIKDDKVIVSLATERPAHGTGVPFITFGILTFERTDNDSLQLIDSKSFYYSKDVGVTNTEKLNDGVHNTKIIEYDGVNLVFSMVYRKESSVFNSTLLFYNIEDSLISAEYEIKNFIISHIDKKYNDDKYIILGKDNYNNYNNYYLEISGNNINTISKRKEIKFLPVSWLTKPYTTVDGHDSYNPNRIGTSTYDRFDTLDGLSNLVYLENGLIALLSISGFYLLEDGLVLTNSTKVSNSNDKSLVRERNLTMRELEHIKISTNESYFNYNVLLATSTMNDGDFSKHFRSVTNF